MHVARREISVSGTFLIIDGNNLFYRAFYALPRLTAPDGTPTGATFGFVKMLGSMLEKFEPEFVVVVFDAPGKTFREELFEAYKETRQKMPEDMSLQLPAIKEILRLRGIPVLEVEGVEADDVIGKLAREGRKKELEVVIVSSDKDLCQLIGDGVKMYDSLKDRFIDEKYVVDKYGVTPDRIVDLIALAGDQSDNIPGVPGIGEKTAASLLREYGSLDGLLRNLDFVKGKRGQLLRENVDRILVSRDLARIRDDVDIPLEVREFRIGEDDEGRLREIFSRLGFKLPLLGLDEEPLELNEVEPVAVELRTREELEEFFVDSRSREVSVVLAGSGVVLFAGNGGVSFCDSPLIPEMVRLFESKKKKPVFYDAKAVAKSVEGLSPLLDGEFDDVLVMVYLLIPEESSLQFERMAVRITGESLPALGDEKSRRARQAELLLEMREKCELELNREGLFGLYRDMERPLVGILLRMEERGIRLKPAILERLGAEIEKELEEIEKRVSEYAGGDVNLSSPKQVSHLLFDKLKLPVIKKTKTGYSTDMSVLEELCSLHEVPALIMNHRMLSKLKSTYVDVLPKMVNEKTGRIHASFNQTATATGRLSSSNPNLQNIPIRSEIGRKIRDAFVPEEGYIFLGADYSQIELRVLAHLSGDEALCEVFHRGRDVHTETAVALFGVNEDEVTPEMRRRAKVVNFGIIYGMTPFGLSKELRISQGEAKKYIDGYFSRYPRVKSFIDETIERARRDGFVETLFGRKRRLPDISSRNQTLRSAAERMAVNTPVQGTAADIIKLSMIRLDRLLKEEGVDAHLVLQIHDELVLEVREDELEKVKGVLKEAMEAVVDLRVPLVVDLKWGRSWGEL